MSAILNGNDSVNRLIETLAGSAVLLSNPAGATSILPSAISPMQSEPAAEDTANASASANGDGSNASFELTPLASSGDAGAGTGAILDNVAAATGLGSDGNTNLLGDLPIVGDGGSMGSLPIIGDGGSTGSLPIIGNPIGSAADPLTLAGSDGTLQPVFDPLNAGVKEVHTILEVLSHQVGLPDVIHGVTNLGETIGLGEIGHGNNLITDVVNLPGAIVNGDLDQSVAHIGNDLTDIVHGVGALAGYALQDFNDPSNPIPEIIQGVGGSLQSQPLLTVDGGNTGSNLLGGVVGDLSHSSSGHLVDIDIGPAQQNGGLPINVFAANQDGPHHTVEINAIDVGPGGPHLADVGVLTGGQALNSGADSLVGNVLGNAGSGAASSPVAAVTQVADLHDLVPSVAAVDHGPLDLHGAHII